LKLSAPLTAQEGLKLRGVLSSVTVFLYTLSTALSVWGKYCYYTTLQYLDVEFEIFPLAKASVFVTIDELAEDVAA
jgi:hypothetical protein